MSRERRSHRNRLEHIRTTKNKTPHKVVWKTLLQPSYLRSKTRKDANEYRKRSYQGTSAQSLSAHWWLCRARPDGGQGARNSKWDSGRVPLQLSTRQHAFQLQGRPS